MDHKNKIDLKHGGSFLDYLDCFQYTITARLNQEKIKKDCKRITKMKPFINKYNWEGINILPEKYGWKKIAKNQSNDCFQSPVC